ncbi:hypothetical protein LDENG_00234320, partial [Lucifuga dentata]
MFEPHIFNFHTCYVTDNHFPKDKTVFQLSRYFAKSLLLFLSAFPSGVTTVNHLPPS